MQKSITLIDATPTIITDSWKIQIMSISNSIFGIIKMNGIPCFKKYCRLRYVSGFIRVRKVND